MTARSPWDCGHGDGAARNGGVRIHDVGEGALRTVLNDRCGDDERVLACRKSKSRLHELIRPKRCVGLSNTALSLRVAVCTLICVVDHGELPRAEGLVAITAHSLDRKLSRGHCLVDRREIILGEREEDRDRVELRHHDEAGGVRGMHHISRIDEAEAGHAVDGGRDARIVEVELGGVDRSLIALHLGAS